MVRFLFGVFVVGASLQFTGCGGQSVKGQEKEAPKWQTGITISKEVTFATGPLDEHGYVDYAGALNNHYSQGTNPDNNAAVFYVRATGPRPADTDMPLKFFQLLEIEKPPAEGDYFIALDEFAKAQAGDRPEPDMVSELQNRALEEPWRRSDLPFVAEWLDRMEQPLKLVVEGTKRPKYFLPLVLAESNDENEGPPVLIMALLPTVQTSRSLARALTCRAMLHVGERRVQAAWDDLLACHRLGRHIGQGPTLIEALVGIAIEGIAQRADIQFIGNTNPTADQVKQYLRDLESLPPLPSMAEKINRCERMMFLDAIQMLARGGNLSDLVGGGENKFDHVLRALSTGAIDWNIPMRTGNEWYDRMYAAMSEEDPFSKRNKLSILEQDLEKTVENVKKPWSLAGSLLLNPRRAMGKAMGQVMIALMLPAVAAADTAQDRVGQSLANLKVAFALAAYRSDVGDYPRQLTDLVPKYLQAVPPDLFATEPLRYRPNKLGYLLYSVGPNGEDDDGRWHDDEPPGDDPHIRMPPVIKPN